MFVRKKPNKSGSYSIQIIDKSSGRYKVVETIGSSKDKNKIHLLIREAYHRMAELQGQQELSLLTINDKTILNFLQNSTSLKVRVVGPNDILGRIFDSIGFNQIDDELFKILVITRLVHPVSKLKTIDYLKRYNSIEIDKNQIYRFLDKLTNRYKTQLEEIAYRYTKKLLKGKVSVVFYDITTLYFESSEEDDLRRLGFSKDGKSQNPQILLGMLVGKEGYPIGYDIFEGNKFEGKTLLPMLEKYEQRFHIRKPIVVTDAGLLSRENIEQLLQRGYQYILGARIKNQERTVKEKILNMKLKDMESAEIKMGNNSRLIIGYSEKRAKKDLYNRTRGLRRLEKNLTSGKLTKKQINNRGYNKYLKLNGNLTVEIDYEKYNEDRKWDGLKGYLTNCKLSVSEVIKNYNELWQIEKAFRISKTDLRVRPIYHRLKDRIEAHLSIAFAAYTIYKELERLLKSNNINISAKRATELTETIYALDVQLPDSKIKETIILDMSNEQKLLYELIRTL